MAEADYLSGGGDFAVSQGRSYINLNCNLESHGEFS